MRRVALLVALLVATACQTSSRPVPLSPDDERPLAYLRGLVEGAEALRSLRGRARLAVDSDDGSVRIRVSQILVLERPAQLRVEVLGLLSQTALVLASDGTDYQLFIPGEGRYQSGPVYPELLREVSGIGVPPGVIVDLVLGGSIPSEDLTIADAAITSDGQIQVALADAEGTLRRRLAFDSLGRLSRVEALEAGRPVWGAHFDGYEDLDGRAFAHEIQLEVFENASRAELSLRDVELNPSLSAEVFRLDLPRFQGRAGGGGG